MEDTAGLIDKYATQIVDAVRQAAPEVWAAAYRYAIAGCIGWGVLSILVLVGCVRFWRWAWARQADWVDETNWWIACGVTVGVAVIACAVLIQSLTNLIALDWLAIKHIAGLARPN